MLKARIRDFSNVNEVNWLYYEISNIELDDMKQVNKHTSIHTNTTNNHNTPHTNINTQHTHIHTNTY